MNESLTRARAATADDGARDAYKQRLRLWLRLLMCSTLVEREVRTRLRERFATTLPRFDALAALDRAPDGFTLGELSARLMVSNGNLTGLIARLVESGLVHRWSPDHDRRASIVALTDAGRAAFTTMAEAHEAWIGELLGPLAEEDVADLIASLDKTRRAIEQHGEAEMI